MDTDQRSVMRVHPWQKIYFLCMAARRSDTSNDALGYFIFSDTMVSTRIWATARLRNHFLFEGMTYQGARSVLHSVMASSYASRYWFQYWCSLKSVGESFQILLLSSRRASRRCSCSFLLMLRKNFSTTTLFLTSIFSNSLI